MQEQETVSVFSFRVFDVDAGEMRISKYKATRESIASHFGGELLKGTEQLVSVEELDGNGRFHRIATGWGELG